MKDLSKEGKLCYKKIPTAKKCNVMFCILCEYRWKAIKASAAAKIAATAAAAKTSKKNLKKSSTPGGERAPKKKKELTTASLAVIRELRRVAAFYSQVYIFTKVEKAKANHRFALIEEHFYGNPLKRIKGACKMLLEGEGPFRAFFNIIEGEYDQELVLKASCCGKDTASSYIAGVHFSVEDLHTFGVNKKLKGCQLRLMGLTVLRSIKKAISIVPKLVLSICSIDKNCAVIAYVSGKNESSLMQFINNGMFALSMNECGDTTMINAEIGSDKDDNKVLGATSAEGMPLTRDDASAEGMPLTSDDTLIQRENIDVDAPVEDDDNVEVNNVEVDVEKRDAFGNVIAPKGYVYTSKLVFICFGPTSKYFAGTLVMGGKSD